MKPARNWPVFGKSKLSILRIQDFHKPGTGWFFEIHFFLRPVTGNSLRNQRTTQHWFFSSRHKIVRQNIRLPLLFCFLHRLFRAPTLFPFLTLFTVFWLDGSLKFERSPFKIQTTPKTICWMYGDQIERVFQIWWVLCISIVSDVDLKAS